MKRYFFGMNRRNFFGSSLGSAIAISGIMAARKGDQASAAIRKRQHVLVLGAGASGLTAAMALEKVGHQVTVIEYQDRVGGRVWSFPLKGGQHSELGAGHFRGNMPYVGSYIRNFNLPTITLNDGLPKYLYDGKSAKAASLSSWPWNLKDSEKHVNLPSLFQHYLSFHGLDADLVLDPKFLENSNTLSRFSNITTGELLREAGASDDFIALIGVHTGGGSPMNQPALVGLPDIAYHFGDQYCYRIKGGNDLLTTAMANSLRGDVVLNSPVSSIRVLRDKVSVTCRNGKVFTGDHVISTIPPSVLDEVAITPRLSSSKNDAFNALEWAETIKVVVQLQSDSWLKENVHGWPMAAGDRPWERIIDITGNDNLPSGFGNTFIYLNNPENQALLRTIPSDKQASNIIGQFRIDNPELLDDVIYSHVWDWTAQPWIKKSLGFVKLGQGEKIRELQFSDGRLHWAGDWTTLKTGWVEGAIESGLRAARKIDPSSSPVSPFIRAEKARRTLNP